MFLEYTNFLFKDFFKLSLKNQLKIMCILFRSLSNLISKDSAH